MAILPYQISAEGSQSSFSLDTSQPVSESDANVYLTSEQISKIVGNQPDSGEAKDELIKIANDADMSEFVRYGTRMHLDEIACEKIDQLKARYGEREDYIRINYLKILSPY